jgi:antitoxin (DNA-binding transcriptional repressor) of toxin-antitoxin stability system
MSLMKEIDISSTNQDPAALRQLIASGEDIFLTAHGEHIAKLVPASGNVNRTRSREASDRIRARAKQLKLGRFDWKEWKAYRDEGRP